MPEAIPTTENKPVIQSPLNKAAIDKWLFIFNLPDALKDLRAGHNVVNKELGVTREAVKWSLMSANIPSISIKADTVPFQGGNMYISSHTKTPYEPLVIHMKVDNLYNNYFTVYEWLNYIYDEREGHFDANGLAKGAAGLNKYSTNVSIVALDEYNKPVIQWVFTKAFPSELSGLNLNFQNSDEIELSATFLFSQMLVRGFRGNLSLDANVS